MRRTLSCLVCVLLVTAILAPAGAAPGVREARIKIGLHAPLTGASPIASDSTEKGKDLYFRWLRSKDRPIHGRHVDVILRNDQSDPSTAAEVCREMVEQERVFMLVGFGGERQIKACARYAESARVPYVSPATTKNGFDLRRYFATTMTWERQGDLLADFLVSRGARRQKNAFVTYRGKRYRGVTRAFRNGLESRGARLHYSRRIDRGAGSSEARTLVDEMKKASIDNAFVLTTPVFFLNLEKQAETREFQPLWTGIGQTMTVDVVAEVACDGGPFKSKFFSAYPAFADRADFDPAFDRAAEHFYPDDPLLPDDPPDDTMWQLWAHDKALAGMFRATGRDLTRRRFVSLVERARISTGVGPNLKYRPRNHFGARTVHLLKADCNDGRWHTVRSFVRDF